MLLRNKEAIHLLIAQTAAEAVEDTHTFAPVILGFSGCAGVGEVRQTVNLDELIVLWIRSDQEPAPKMHGKTQICEGKLPSTVQMHANTRVKAKLHFSQNPHTRMA
jgi:hypothetical protein